MPVLWHQSLLTFIQRYKNSIKIEYIEKLKKLILKQNHKLISNEIKRELININTINYDNNMIDINDLIEK